MMAAEEFEQRSGELRYSARAIEALDRVHGNVQKLLNGEVAFKLYDT